VKDLRVVKLGYVDFEKALYFQRAIFKRLHTKESCDTLILAEHYPVYTCGRSANPSVLIKKRLPEGINLTKVDRGGSITYHGPGQLMIYPVISISEATIGSYLKQLELVIERALAVFGIKTHIADVAGVWTGSKKLASLGIKVSSGLTMHGASLNVNCNLSFFEPIYACGLRTKFTSMKEILGYEIGMVDIADLIMMNFGKIFNYRIRPRGVFKKSERSEYAVFPQNKAK